MHSADARPPKPSPIEWCCLVGGLFLTMHYAWLMDDAFVYFRYVDNLVYLKFGLVYNKGEYVEGFSSPLWILLLSAARSTGLNFWIIIRVIAVLSFTAFWLLLVVLNRRMAPPRAPVINFPLCYLSFAYGPLCYFTSGLESPLVQVAATIYALFILRPTSRILQLLIAASPLLRHELAVPLLVCLLWIWFRRKSFPLGMFLAATAVNGAWLAFRIYYYADLFPNTFYLKDMMDVRQGLVYLRETVDTYWLHAMLAAILFIVLIGAILLRRQGRARSEDAASHGTTDSASHGYQWMERGMMVIIACSVAAYVVKIGGDPRHYRFMAFPFCLIVMATSGLVEHGLKMLPDRLRMRSALPVGLAVAAITLTFYPPQLSGHPFFLEEESTEVNKIKDASAHRKRKEMSPPSWGTGRELQFVERYEEFLQKRNGTYAGMMFGSWCFTFYRRFDMRVVHALGLTDAILARTIMKADRPAHKYGLAPLAADIRRIYAHAERNPDRGVFRAAVERGDRPKWIVSNLDSIEIIEKKIFNRHKLLENLRLAFTFPSRIDPKTDPHRSRG